MYNGKSIENIRASYDHELLIKRFLNIDFDSKITFPIFNKGKKNEYNQETSKITAKPRSWQGFRKIAARSAIDCHTKSVVASLLSMHKRLAATDFDRGPFVKVF